MAGIDVNLKAPQSNINKQLLLVCQDIIARLTSVENSSGGGSGSSAWGNITGTLSSQTDLISVLNGKAASSHTHSITNITGLQTDLDGKAPAAHTHSIANVTGLQTALDGKMDVGTEINSYFPNGW